MIVFLVFKINLNNRLQTIILNFMQERDYKYWYNVIVAQKEKAHKFKFTGFIFE